MLQPYPVMIVPPVAVGSYTVLRVRVVGEPATSTVSTPFIAEYELPEINTLLPTITLWVAEQVIAMNPPSFEYPVILAVL